MQISVPPDLCTMKDTVMFGLTKKQMVFFGIGVVIGVPIFFLCLKVIGSSNAALVMLLCMAPFFFLGIYQKNGYSADQILVRKIRHAKKEKIRLKIKYEERRENENKRRKEIKRLEREAEGSILYIFCRFLYASGKTCKKIAGNIADKIDKKPYR